MKKIIITMLGFIVLTLTWCWNNSNLSNLDNILNQNNNEIENETSEKYLTAFWTEPYWDINISWNMATFFEMNMEDYENRIEIPITLKVDGDVYYFFWNQIEWTFEEKDCIDWGKWDTHYYTVIMTYDNDMVFKGCWDDERGVKYSEDEIEENWEAIESTVDLSWIEWFIRNCENYSPYRVDRSETIENVSFSWNNKSNIGTSYKVDWVMNYTADWTPHSDEVSCTFTSDDIWDVRWNWEDIYWSFLHYYWKTSKEEECINGLDIYPPEWMKGDPQTVITVWCWPENYWDEYVTWYFYTSTYPDLWLRITTPAGYESFHKKSETPIFERNWNRISYIVSGEEREYLQVYEKKPSEDLKEIIKKWIDKWCSILEYNYYWQEKVFADYPWTIIYNIFDNWGEPGKCLLNDEKHNEEWNRRPVWYFESKDKTKYYKLVMTDWCAPWPCSIFWEIELI